MKEKNSVLRIFQTVEEDFGAWVIEVGDKFINSAMDVNPVVKTVTFSNLQSLSGIKQAFIHSDIIR